MENPGVQESGSVRVSTAIARRFLHPCFASSYQERGNGSRDGGEMEEVLTKTAEQSEIYENWDFCNTVLKEIKGRLHVDGIDSFSAEMEARVIILGGGTVTFEMRALFSLVGLYISNSRPRRIPFPSSRDTIKWR